MACGLGDASSLGCHLLLPQRRPPTNQEGEPQVSRVGRFPGNLAFSALRPFNSKILVVCRIGTSSSLTGAAAVAENRNKDVLAAHKKLSVSSCFDAMCATHLVISGYWAGPDIDDGCGSVEAMLYRIA